MKRRGYIVALMIIPIGMTTVLAQEDVITLRIDDEWPHQRPRVSFPHAQHGAVIDCVRCHHSYDELGNNQGSIGASCSSCHGPDGPQAAVVPLVRAFHVQCKTCHAEGRTSGRHGGPVICGECHRRR
jgi:hypothetical protein